jgi:hypothetical protein
MIQVTVRIGVPVVVVVYVSRATTKSIHPMDVPVVVYRCRWMWESVRIR